MMRLSELRKLVELQTGQRLEDDQVIALVNKALRLIAEKAGYYTTEQALAVVPNTWYQLPLSVIQVEEVMLGIDKYTNYRYLQGKIAFADAGDYMILVKSMPPRLTAVTDETGVHEVFDNLIADYVTTYVERQGQEQKTPPSTIEEVYAQKAVQLARSLQKRKAPVEWTVVR